VIAGAEKWVVVLGWCGVDAAPILRV
jgi:hypothetical protein